MGRGGLASVHPTMPWGSCEDACPVPALFVNPLFCRPCPFRHGIYSMRGACLKSSKKKEMTVGGAQETWNTPHVYRGCRMDYVLGGAGGCLDKVWMAWMAA